MKFFKDSDSDATKPADGGKETLSEQERFKDAARVAMVFDHMFKVVINKGENDGVGWGDEFRILRLGPEVKDPITHESLGRLVTEVGRGRVSVVQDKMTTIKSVETRPCKSRNVSNLFSAMTEDLVPFDDPMVGDYAVKC